MKTIEQRLKGINETIENSYYTYKEYADKKGYSLKAENMEAAQENFHYIPEANLAAVERVTTGQFRIGNNLPSAE